MGPPAPRSRPSPDSARRGAAAALPLDLPCEHGEDALHLFGPAPRAGRRCGVVVPAEEALERPAADRTRVLENRHNPYPPFHQYGVWSISAYDIRLAFATDTKPIIEYSPSLRSGLGEKDSRGWWDLAGGG